ncbi:SH3 domain-containing protein [Burkholderia cenocepacia]|uniref:SH3 domain-containing protein n=1 Tax=Burkholderia cenocepacia TaxID=95486 RepID=UPI000B1A2127|nr:SH3 domain-containing protein [Burkholderia cenocepacia]
MRFAFNPSQRWPMLLLALAVLPNISHAKPVAVVLDAAAGHCRARQMPQAAAHTLSAGEQLEAATEVSCEAGYSGTGKYTANDASFVISGDWTAVGNPAPSVGAPQPGSELIPLGRQAEAGAPASSDSVRVMFARALDPKSQTPLKLYAAPSLGSQTVATLPADHAPLRVTEKKKGFYGVVIDGKEAWVSRFDVTVTHRAVAACSTAPSKNMAGTLKPGTNECGQ